MGGKHHWPVTTAMVIGGVTGGRTMAALTTKFWQAQSTLHQADRSQWDKLTPGHLGATLLALADIDPTPFIDASPILGIIE